MGLGYLVIIYLFVSNSPTDFRWSVRWSFMQSPHMKLQTRENAPLISSVNNLKDLKIRRKSVKQIWSEQWVPLLTNLAFWVMFFTYAGKKKLIQNFFDLQNDFSAMSVLRYTLFYWAGIYLKAHGATDGEAALGSLVFPAAGGLGAIFIGLLSDKMKTNYGKNMVMVIFSLLSTFAFFVLWFLEHEKLVSVTSILILYAFSGFLLLGVYSLPCSLISIRFGDALCATCASLMDLGGSVTMAFSGLMSELAGKDNRWDRVWLVCCLISFLCTLLLVLFVYVDNKNETSKIEVVEVNPL